MTFDSTKKEAPNILIKEKLNAKPIEPSESEYMKLGSNFINHKILVSVKKFNSQKNNNFTPTRSQPNFLKHLTVSSENKGLSKANK